MGKESQKKRDQMSSKERYDYLVKARNFHYDNFSKWMTYFYVATGTLFVGFYTIQDQPDVNIEKSILLILGYITSISWYWSSKGYYYWNINFITLINQCEKEVLKLDRENRIYSVFANKKRENNYINPIMGANVSTSKVAIFLSFIVTVFWGTLLLGIIGNMNIFEMKSLNYLIYLIVSAILTIILTFTIAKKFFKSNMSVLKDLKI